MKRVLTFVYIALIACVQMYAQGFGYYGPSHSISIVGEYGNTSLKNLDFKDIGSMKRDYSVGLEYQYRINRNWGVVTGAGWRKYDSSIHVADFLQEQLAPTGYIAESGVDHNGNAYELRFSGSQTERYAINYLEVPLKVRFFIPVASWFEFYIGTGVAGGYNFKESAAITEGSYDRTAFFKDLNILVDDNPTLGLAKGRTEFYNPTSRHFNQFNVSALGEVGLSFHASYNVSFNLGLNTVYGLMDARQMKTTLGSTETYSGVIHTQTIERVSPFTASIKAGITIRFGKNPSKKNTTPVPEIEQFIPEPVTTAKPDTVRRPIAVAPIVVVPQPVVQPKDTVSRSVETTLSDSTTMIAKRYCVVVGSFLAKDDAEKLSVRFKADGFKTIVLSKGLHHRVVVDSYDTMWGAMRRLPAIRLRYALYDIWVYDQKSRF